MAHEIWWSAPAEAPMDDLAVYLVTSKGEMRVEVLARHPRGRGFYEGVPEKRPDELRLWIVASLCVQGETPEAIEAIKSTLLDLATIRIGV